jgi:hypothetical protein
VFLAAAAPAQVPDGHYVTAHFSAQNLGTGGLFTFHPRNGSWIRVTGLPQELTGLGSPFSIGANAVAILPDRTVVAGPISAPNATLTLYHLWITNGMGTVLRAIPLGVGISGLRAQVAEVEVLGPDRVLVAVSTITKGALGPPGPLVGHQLGIVTLSTGAVIPCPLVPMPQGVANAVAGDARWAYVAMFDSVATRTDIWRVDHTMPNLPPTLLIQLPQAQINGLELRGNLLVTTGSQRATIDVRTGTVLAQCPFSANAAETETVTGMVAGVNGSAANQDVWWSLPCGPKTLLAAPPTGGWGLPGGIAVARNPIVYGGPSPVPGPDYRFRLDPNPGGMPLLGNTTFSLSVAGSTGGAAAGAWLLSFGPQQPSLPILGIDLHVSLPLLWASWPIQASPTQPAVLPLGVPPNPNYIGIRLFVQSVHVHGAGLAASEGVRLTVL